MYTPEVKREKALAYLKEKYKEEFVATAMSESGWGQGQDKIYIYPKNGTEEDTFAVWGNIWEDGSYAMSDGYFGVIIHDKYEISSISILMKEEGEEYFTNDSRKYIRVSRKLK
ncbi:hypothetical protein [Clostridium psychrophilum]|uniref:hypothetical protein n=1 Tax=Clostridium psychrophilum TaxID=132926 RepID=UPI001C0DB6F2|nr:hypothetical protein [Clostridium psychrophilum]MBU3181429.1 hypothetical protein [Clostridium psychrophilum]